MQTLRTRVGKLPPRISGRRARGLAEAWRMAAALVAAPTLADQLTLLLEAAPRVSGADTATILLRDDTSGALYPPAGHGHRLDAFGPPRAEGLTEHVLATGQLVVVDDAATDPHVDPVVAAAGLRSFVALPLLVRQASPALPSGEVKDEEQRRVSADPATLRAIGVMYVNARRPRAFPAQTVETLQGLAALAAVAIEHGRLLEAQRTAAEHLADAVRVREQFVSVASHELKGPLTPLKGYAQALRRRIERAAEAGQPLDSVWVNRALTIMTTQVDRLDRLVIDLLDASRVRAGRFAIAPEPLDLVTVAQASFERFRDTVAIEAEAVKQMAEHRLSFHAGATSLPGSWDSTRLDQLMTNLLSNAVKYSPNGGLVELLVEPACDDAESRLRYQQRASGFGSHWVHLRVRDEGIGLPPGEAAKELLFTPFARGANAPSNRFSGFGLGLYICAEIVQRHGGAIWAESAGEFRGTTVHVLLPPAPPAPAAPSEPSLDPAAQPAQLAAAAPPHAPAHHTPAAAP